MDEQEDAQELETLKSRLREMEEESEKFKRMQDETDKQMSTSEVSSKSDPTRITLEEKQEIDTRSIYVGNVDYSATADDLERHFHGCGSVNRVTILQDKFTGAPKGFAYVEFAEKDSVQIAIALDESLFKGRLIKVCPKRTNRPGMSMRAHRGGYGGFRGRGGYIGPARGGGYRPPFPGRGRGRGRGYGYAPY